MSLKSFQQALGDLVLDPRFRCAVADDPKAALEGFDLSPREHRRLAILVNDPRPGLRGTLRNR